MNFINYNGLVLHLLEEFNSPIYAFKGLSCVYFVAIAAGERL